MWLAQSIRIHSCLQGKLREEPLAYAHRVDVLARISCHRTLQAPISMTQVDSCSHIPADKNMTSEHTTINDLHDLLHSRGYHPPDTWLTPLPNALLVTCVCVAIISTSRAFCRHANFVAAVT